MPSAVDQSIAAVLERQVRTAAKASPARRRPKPVNVVFAYRVLIREDGGIERIESREAVGEMNDGNQACKILTQTAREHDVPVAIANEPICNRAAQEGDNLWAPGTLNFVGGSQGRAPVPRLDHGSRQENPGPQKVAVVTGPDLNANTINTDLALKDVKAKYPDFDVVAVVRTDYSIVEGNSKTVPLFQAHPDLTILISNYSDMTRGAVQAAREATV